MKTKRIYKQGFTIIELLSYIVVLTSILGAAIFFAVNLVRNERLLSARTRIVNETDFALRSIVDATRVSARINPSTASPLPSVLAIPGTPCVTGCRLSIKMTKDGTQNAVFYLSNTGRLIKETIIGGNSTVHELTSRRVSVVEFIATCIGSAISCQGDPQGAVIKLTVRDALDPSQSQTMTTSVIAGEY